MKDLFLQIKRHFRFLRICKALKIKPRKWQRKFVFHGASQFPTGRRTGKTTAIILNALVKNPENASLLYDALSMDPDFGTIYSQRMWHYSEYVRNAEKCRECDIAVNSINSSQFKAEIAKRSRHYRNGR